LKTPPTSIADLYTTFASFSPLPSPLFLLPSSFQGGWTPLHFAALAGNLECVKLLLNRKKF